MRIIEYQNLKWIDIVNPKEEDMKFLAEKFGFHQLILDEIKTPTFHPLIESYGTYLFWILHFPNFAFGNDQIQAVEVDLLITKDALITVRYCDFTDFEEIFQMTKEKPASYLHKTTGHLVYYLIKSLLNRTFPELDSVKEEIDRSEDQVFRAFDENIIEKITLIKRRIIDFIRAIKPQKAIWDAAPEIILGFWGERLKPYFSDLIVDYNRILHIAETHKEIVDSLHLTSSSLLDHRRNYAIKILTIFTAILLPLSLFASIYGMNLLHLPLANHPSAFWWFIGGMILVIIAMLGYFHKQKWI